MKGTVQYKERERSHNKPHGSGLSVQGGKEKDQTGPVDKNQDHGERCGVRERGEEETDVIDLSSSRMRSTASVLAWGRSVNITLATQ